MLAFIFEYPLLLYNKKIYLLKYNSHLFKKSW